MPDLYDELTNWASGVITAARPDQIPKDAVQRADNTQFAFIAPGRAVFRKRRGMTLVNKAPLHEGAAGIGSPVVGQFEYPVRVGSALTVKQVRITASGRIYVGQDNGSDSETFTELTSTGLSATTELPDFAVANNRAFLLDGKGGRASLKDTARVDWGIGVVTGLALAFGGTGSMSGAYDVVVTKYNSDLLEEGNISAEVSISGGANQQLTVTVDSVPLAQSNFFFRVYLRKPSLSSGFFRVLSGTGFNATHQAFPLNSASPTVSTTIDISDTELTEDLIIRAPVAGTRDEPPAGVHVAAWWQRRMFVATDDTLFWSEENKPDAFSLFSSQPINDNRGGRVRGLKIAHDRLNIFTEFGRFELIGSDDPRTWEIRLVDPEGGLDGHASFAFHNGTAYWWNHEHGPLAWDGRTTHHLGTELLGELVRATNLNGTRLSQIHTAGVDEHVVFWVPEVGQNRLTKAFVWHARIAEREQPAFPVWESGRWDPMDVASCATIQDASGVSHMYLGNYNGQIFRLFQGGNDGVRTGTRRGTFVAGSTSISSITDAAATFDAVATGNSGLIERRITILDSAGKKVSNTRPRITTNTATVLTLDNPFGGLTVGQTYTYLIGGPDFTLDTYWGDLGRPFIPKRFDRLFTQFIADDGTSELRIDIAFSFDALRNTTAADFDTSTTLWDVAEWDVAFWDDIPILTRKMRLHTIGLNYRVRLLNPYPDQGFTLLKIGALARELSERYLDNFGN